MNKINWKVRMKSKVFWVSFIPALALMVQAALAVFGVEMNFDELVNNLIVLVNTVFVVLVLLGLVVDPTTDGVADSEQALTYEKPKKDE